MDAPFASLFSRQIGGSSGESFSALAYVHLFDAPASNRFGCPHQLKRFPGLVSGAAVASTLWLLKPVPSW
jgi:hypothetical protein